MLLYQFFFRHLLFDATIFCGSFVYAFVSITTKRSIPLALLKLRRPNLRRHQDIAWHLFSSDESVQFESAPVKPHSDVEESEYYNSLRSSYPPNTPAGLRGEAIRSALTKSKRCLIWDDLSNLSYSSVNGGGYGAGLLQIDGPGTLPFLHSKLTADFSNENNRPPFYKEACLLDAKGRLVDWLRVAVVREDKAFLWTSPGHSSSDLLQRLDPFVFPLDQITLKDFDSLPNCENETSNNSKSFSFSLASTQYEYVQSAIRELQDAQIGISVRERMEFPNDSRSFSLWKVSDEIEVLVIPSIALPTVACVGYTFTLFGSRSAVSLGQRIYHYMVGEENVDGPVEVGPREFETLRIQSGMPRYGCEFGSSINRNSDEDGRATIKTSPLELHWTSTLALDKGCYLGQEGIASILKNRRGPPRQLYSVVFEDDFNYEAEFQRDENYCIDSPPKFPLPGQQLFVLGSNERIAVGTLTSVGEAGGSGDATTVALALIKRPDTIQKQMKDIELGIDRDIAGMHKMEVEFGSGIIQPPPMDPLDGLRVNVQGTFSVGVLKSVPSRRMQRDANMFDDSIRVRNILLDGFPSDVSLQNGLKDMNGAKLIEMQPPQELQAELEMAKLEAETAAKNARRKAEKLELLKKRAEEAMARRKQKN